MVYLALGGYALSVLVATFVVGFFNGLCNEDPDPFDMFMVAFFWPVILLLLVILAIGYGPHWLGKTLGGKIQ